VGLPPTAGQGFFCTPLPKFSRLHPPSVTRWQTALPILKFALIKLRCCPSPLPPPAGDCGYLAANLYAKSVFGEDALVNVSVEKQADGRLAGYIRIRSKTQGIALSLGDKITLQMGKRN